MRIATWNVERLKHRRELDKILLACTQADADILVLTETDERVNLCYHTIIRTPKLTEIAPKYYKPTENRVSIFTRYKCLRQFPTYDKYTALCAELETEKGNLLVYGTIIGIYGNRNENFKTDLPKQIEDFKRLSAGHNLCVCGDYNLTFSDNYYHTEEGRNAINECFSQIGMRILTAERPCCVDHIALPDRLIAGSTVTTQEWNLDKSLSDHKGIVVEF